MRLHPWVLVLPVGAQIDYKGELERGECFIVIRCKVALDYLTTVFGSVKEKIKVQKRCLDHNPFLDLT